MNGVIVDDELLHKLAFQKVFKSIGNSLSDEEFEKYFLGHTDKDGFFLAFKSKKINKDLKEYVSKKANYYKKLAQDNLKPFPGIINFINKISKKYNLALASGSSLEEVKVILNTFSLIDKFKVIVGAEDVAKGKPEPEIYLLAARKLKLLPNQCLVIEDTVSGVEAAKSAGMICIAITNTVGKKELIGADKIVDNISEIKIIYE